MAHAALLRVCLRMLVAREGAPQRTLLDREGTPPRVLVAREGRHTPRVLTEGERWRLAFAVERYAAQEPLPPPQMAHAALPGMCQLYGHLGAVLEGRRGLNMKVGRMRGDAARE